jgi:hypothetical protein
MSPASTHTVAAPQLAGRDDLHVAASGDTLGGGVAPGAPEGVRLRLAAPLRHRLGEVGEKDGEPEPDGDGEDEGERRHAARDQPLDEDDRGDRRADLDDEHHWVTCLHARIELGECAGQRASDDLRCPRARRAGALHLGHFFGWGLRNGWWRRCDSHDSSLPP